MKVNNKEAEERRPGTKRETLTHIILHTKSTKHKPTYTHTHTHVHTLHGDNNLHLPSSANTCAARLTIVFGTADDGAPGRAVESSRGGSEAGRGRFPRSCPSVERAGLRLRCCLPTATFATPETCFCFAVALLTAASMCVRGPADDPTGRDDVVEEEAEEAEDLVATERGSFS
jgi:hypothetical protein